MTLNTYSSSLVSRFELANLQRQPEGYYRSKLFMISTSTNPLLSSANPVFSLLERIGLSSTLPSIESIRDSIAHELYAFQSNLARKNHAEELVMIAHYLLCATVDELIGKNYLRVVGTPVEFVAFTPLSNDNQGPQELFFEIVNHLKEKTHQYLDLIELAYYCLITGFEGEKHMLTDGRQVLDNLIEELHQLINQHRVHKPNLPLREKIMPLPMQTNHTSILVVALITAGIIFSMWYSSYAWLNHKASGILLKHQPNSTSMDYE